MSDSTPNQVEAASTGSMMQGSIGIAGASLDTSTVSQSVRPTPLAEALKPLPSPLLQPYRGTESIRSFSTASAELSALLHTAGVHDLGWRRRIRCAGEDRVRWLNGMVTNFVSSLDENAGCYAFVLNAQGRIQGDLDIYRRADSFWLETDASQVEALSAFLDRYIIMDDVTLELQPQWTAIGIAGPGAAATLDAASLPVPSPAMHLSQATWHGHSVIVTCTYGPIVARYEIWLEHEFLLEMWNALQTAGALPCGIDAVESLRILEGTPAYSVDISAKDLPQETNQMRALHFNKGCYLGQEIVERIHSRGNVHRTFTGFVLADDRPTPGTALLAEGKPIGEITSAARVLLPGTRERVVALGSIRREILDRKCELLAGETVARHSPLPFPFSREYEPSTETLR